MRFPGASYCFFKVTMNLSLTKTDTAVVKGIAILAMLMHHVFESLTSEGVVIAQLQSIGKVCVALFVLLSGYGLSVGYQRLTPPHHLWESAAWLVVRRLLKFYVNYWCIFLIFVPIGILFFHRPLDAGYWEGVNVIKSFVWDVLGVAGFQSYNITWWFNKLILTLYILSPIVFIFTKQFPIASVLFVFFMQRFKMLGGTYFLDLYLMPFVLGFVWAQKAEQIQNEFTRFSPKVGFIAAFLLLVATAYLRQRGILLSPLEWDTCLAVAIALFVIMCKPYRWGLDTILAFLGKHSINIYMMHTFVYYYFWHEEIFSIGDPWLILLAVTAITLSFSVLLEVVKKKIRLEQLPGMIIDGIKV